MLWEGSTTTTINIVISEQRCRITHHLQNNNHCVCVFCYNCALFSKYKVRNQSSLTAILTPYCGRIANVGPHPFHGRGKDIPPSSWGTQGTTGGPGRWQGIDLNPSPFQTLTLFYLGMCGGVFILVTGWESLPALLWQDLQFSALSNLSSTLQPLVFHPICLRRMKGY